MDLLNMALQLRGVPDEETPRSKHHNTPRIELAVWILIALASALLTLRICYRTFRSRLRLWADDYFLVAALLCLIGNAITIAKWIPNKVLPNVTRVAPAEIVLAGSLMGLFNSFALAFGKTSLATTFVRLTTGWWQTSLLLSIFVMLILFAVQAWTYWLQDCGGPLQPLRLQHGDCIPFESIRDYRIAVQVLSCFLDGYFTLLPWKIVRPLQLRKFEKIGLGIAMSFGCASLATGLVRLSVLARQVHESPKHQPFYSVGGYLFNFCEAGYTIVAACMPVLRKVILDLIEWKKNPDNAMLARIRNYRRKKNTTQTVLPLVATPANSNSETKSASGKTDSTVDGLELTVIGGFSTASTLVSQPPEARSRWVDLPRIA
ncbi:hypothetical protein F5Y17DRAFT_454328 [Xylariaceae sp. FL0594]|nr:hypothetical protein F5Y17DRAFT_454328 [Xylariaceae sp. FL0594]